MAHIPIPPATSQESDIVRSLSALSLTRNTAEYIFTMPHLRDRVIPHCSPATLIRISWTCRTLNYVIREYFTQTFDINEHLRRFVDDPIAFRSLQARTGALISGSNALQFFAQILYEESDLDIYVKSSEVLQVGQWLTGADGYRFVPAHVLHEDPNSNHVPGIAFTQDVVDATEFEEGYGPSQPNVVYTFYKHVTSPSESGNVERRKVQIVSSENNPMELVLKFYSTHLMNIIAYDRAYSLYPFAAFEHRLGVITRTFVNMEKSITKYEKRGWEFILPHQFTHRWEHHLHLRNKRKARLAAFAEQPRWIADQRSWVIKLSLDGLTIPSGMLGDPCYVSTWNFEHNRGSEPVFPNERRPSHSYTIIKSPGFANAYITTDQRILKMMEHVRYTALQKGLPQLENDRFCDHELFRACQTAFEDRGRFMPAPHKKARRRRGRKNH